jgi:signal transduction histidine kinase
MVFQDISATKRRDAMERLFFHDIGNILQGLQGWSESLSEGWVPPEEAARKIFAISERLNHEINSHRRLIQAERGELTGSPAEVEGGQILRELAAGIAKHPSCHGRHLNLDTPLEPALFTTDPDLLLRVLYNMVINAFEATAPGGHIRAAFRWTEDRPHFTVHNPETIPDVIRPRIFQRSFSTKAVSGRGLGTHAMKLFGENLLKGQVGFDTSEQDGTTFWIKLPRALAVAE